MTALTPIEIARMLGRPEPTPEQSRVISAPLHPMLVVAGAGSGKTETIAQRVVYLVANRMVTPESVLGLTFTRKAAGELATRIRSRLHHLADVLAPTSPASAPLTNGDAAPSELDARRADLTDTPPRIGTYHAFAGDLISEFGPLVGIEPPRRVLTATAAWRLARSLVSQWDLDLETDHSPEQVTNHILSISAGLADHLVSADDLDASLGGIVAELQGFPPSSRQRNPLQSDIQRVVDALSNRQALLPLIAAYDAAKRDARAVDFADQMRLAARIVRESDVARQALRERYPVVLLDEYQDTGHAQRVILRGIFGRASEPDAESASGHAVIAVGDPVQSIYGWRGASASNLPQFVTDFPQADGRPADQYELLISFRNTPSVLRIANALSEPVRSGPVPVGTLRSVYSQEAGEDRGDIATATFDTDSAENAALADRIAEVWRADNPPSTAVLVRRRASMAPIAAALRERRVPVEVVGVGGLIDEPEIADIIATMRLLVDHGSGPAALRLLTGARCRIGLADIGTLSRRARLLTPHREPESGAADQGALAHMRSALAEAMGGEEHLPAGLVDAIADPGPAGNYSPEGYRRIGELASDLAYLRGYVTAPLTDLVDSIVRRLNLDIEMLLSPDGRAHIDAFGDVVADLAHNGMGPVEMLDYLATAAEREDGLAPGEVAARDDCVQILTVHAAKGLEWDWVLLPHLSDGVFPSRRASTWLGDSTQLPPMLRGDRADIPTWDWAGAEDQGDVVRLMKRHRESWSIHHSSEERRLFYVAVTRARQRLWLSAHYWQADRKRPSGPGPLLQELINSGLITCEPMALVPDDGAANPLDGQQVTAVWPVDPLGMRRGPVAHAATLVENARVDPARVPIEAWPHDADRQDDQIDPEGWLRDAALLLAQRDRALRHKDAVEVPMPGSLSVSGLVELAEDPAKLAQRLHRPVPRRPAPQARRGTAFHTWLESWFDGEPLVDLAQLPGAHDDEPASDELLTSLIAQFTASDWAQRTPIAVEVPFMTRLADITVRGRMDAVFRDPDGGVTIVDWKTGALPTDVHFRTLAIQLMAYRIAWARLQEVDLSRIRAVFYYVAHDVTLRPDELLGPESLTELINSAIRSAT